MKRIIVASKNPVKINTTQQGFLKMFPEELFQIEGVNVESGVPAQPMSEEETLRGAYTRVENAHKFVPDADFWVGLEGGLEEKNGEMEAFAWIVIKSKSGLVGKGRTGSFFLPKEIIRLIKAGYELGAADDMLFKRENSKQSNGSVGILTGDVITRTTYYEPAVVLALIPFKNPGLY